MSKDIKLIDEKKELEDNSYGLATVEFSSLSSEIAGLYPRKEATDEEKNKNYVQVGDKVQVTRLNKRLKTVVGLTETHKGYVKRILDKNTVEVDFWDTMPVHVPIRSNYLKILLTSKEVESGKELFFQRIKRFFINLLVKRK